VEFILTGSEKQCCCELLKKQWPSSSLKALSMQLLPGLQFIQQLCFSTRGHPLPGGTGK